ncbi:MAG: MBL fold metallo-hydrolase [Oleibacter sp.]|nr:MBL fold metallo-hydrolase [Thalassolituus sp.]
MKISFYGVRGSVSVSGQQFVKYGGNTSCVHVELDCGKHLIFDAGTGLKDLGNVLIKTDQPIYLLLSHHHWDHIQGFPFFAPIHFAKSDLNLLMPAVSENEVFPLLQQMGGRTFPLNYQDLPAQIKTIGLVENSNYDFLTSTRLSTLALNHPGSGLAYKLEAEGVTLAYVTDNELFPPHAPINHYDEWVKFLHGVDVLIHDAQYVDEDMPHKCGWGHSTIRQVIKLAQDAEVKNLALFHHDHERTDDQLDAIAKECDTLLHNNNNLTHSFCTYQGLSLILDKNGLSSV